MKEDCWPANDASPRSSAVAELLTETKTGSLADFSIANAPGEACIFSKFMLKWSYASRISSSSFGGILEFVISSLISLAFVWRFSVLSTSIL